MKKLSWLLLCYIVSNHSIACDICGNYMGITPYDSKNSISFLHRYRVFNGYRNYQEQVSFFPHSAYKIAHGGQVADSANIKSYSSKDFESYKIFEIRCKYFISKRLEVNAFLPLLNNKSKTGNLYIRHTGLGDLSINTGCHLISPQIESGIKQKLIIGLGIKFPTGNFYAHDSNSDRLPFEMQPGTGSIDGFAYVNYLVMANKIGLNVSCNYKVNGKNIYQEHVANSTTDFVSLFYKLPVKKTVFYPSILFNYEYTRGLFVKKQLQSGTCVNALLIGPGVDVYYKSFSVNTSWQFTAFEKVELGELTSVGRITIGVNYSFNRITRKE